MVHVIVSPSDRLDFCAAARSVSTCNAPLNGSLLVYTLGEKSDTAPAVRLGSYGHLLSLLIHVVELLDLVLLRQIHNFRWVSWTNKFGGIA